MKFKVHKKDVERFTKENRDIKLGKNSRRAAVRLVKENEKKLGRLYVRGFLHGLKNAHGFWTVPCSRNNFQRTRDFKSYQTGWLNGLRLSGVLN